MFEAPDMPVTARQPKETLERLLAAVQAGDFAAAAECLSPELEVHEPPGIIISGEHAGPDGWTSMMTKLGRAYDVKVSSHEIAEAGERAFFMAAATFTARATGRSANAAFIEVYRVVDGLIVDIDVYHKDPGALAGLVDE